MLHDQLNTTTNNSFVINNQKLVHLATKINSLRQILNIYNKNAEEPTLPEREEDDGFDGEEFEHRLKRSQKVTGGEVEEEEGIQSQTDRDVVDDGDVKVTSRYTIWRETSQGVKHRSFKKADVVLLGMLIQDERNKWQGGSLKISIVIFAKSLQKDGDDSHDGLDDTELKRGLDDDISNRSRWVAFFFFAGSV